MRAPIAPRRVTGERRIPRRRRLRGARPPLRRPLALLYRRSAKSGAEAPAALRAADGRAVPLAPRLRMALHLSLTLNEQHLSCHVSAAPRGAALALPPGPAGAAPAQRRAETFERLVFAPHSTPAEIAPRTARLVRGVSPASSGQAGERGNAAHGRGREAAVRGAPSGRRRLGGRPAAAPAGAVLQPSPGVAMARRNLFLAARHGDGPRADAAPTPAPAPLFTGMFVEHRDAASLKAVSAVAHAGPEARPAGRGSGFDRLRSRLASAALGPSRRTGRIAPHRPGVVDLPYAADRFAAAADRPGAPGARPPLYLAERSGGRPAAPAAFEPAWAPPPLDYRGAAHPPAPPPQAEARAAPAPLPSAPALDIEAVSRSVISRIEKRLRVERERRGRS